MIRTINCKFYIREGSKEHVLFNANKELRFNLYTNYHHERGRDWLIREMKAHHISDVKECFRKTENSFKELLGVNIESSTDKMLRELRDKIDNIIT